MTAAVLALLVVALLALAAVNRRRCYTVMATAAASGAVAATVLGAADATALGLWVGALALTAVATGAAVVALRRTLEADRRRPLPASGGLIGRVGVVRRPLDPVGQIAVNGELWRARCSWADDEDTPLGEGEAVVVEHVQGLTLTVRRAEIWEVQP